MINFFEIYELYLGIFYFPYIYLINLLIDLFLPYLFFRAVIKNTFYQLDFKVSNLLDNTGLSVHTSI